MDATILEVGFHDVLEDAQLMRDAKVRAAIGKAAMHAAVKFLHQVDIGDGPPLSFLPESPTNPRAIAGANGRITLSWNAPGVIAGSQVLNDDFIYQVDQPVRFRKPDCGRKHDDVYHHEPCGQCGLLFSHHGIERGR